MKKSIDEMLEEIRDLKARRAKIVAEKISICNDIGDNIYWAIVCQGVVDQRSDRQAILLARTRAIVEIDRRVTRDAGEVNRSTPVQKFSGKVN